MRAPAAAGPLENNANNLSPALTWDDDRDLAALDPSEHRTRRYLRRAGLWHLSGLRRLRNCGRCRRAGEDVRLRLTEGAAGLTGLQSCGSVWVCPVCSAKIAARRQLEIQAAIAAWYVMGGRVAFSTFTMRHHRGQGLVMLWDALAKSWESVIGGKSWQIRRDLFGVAGFLRLIEATHGLNGWHVHLHALLFLPGATTSVDLEDLHGWMVGRWSRALERRGFSAVADAQHSHLLDMAAVERIGEYFSKNVDGGRAVPGARGGPACGESADPGPSPRDLSLEFTRSHTKRARTAIGGTTPFGLLDRVYLEGDAESLDLWAEWEQGSKGRRQLGWSRGLRDLLGLQADKDDEEIAAEEIGTREDDLLTIEPEGWAAIIKRPRLIPALLSATEGGGLTGALAFLDLHGIAYALPERG